MGVCCSSEANETGFEDFKKRKKTIRKCYSEAMYKRSPDGLTKKYPFWEKEIWKGTKNDGWSCDGNLFLTGGC